MKRIDQALNGFKWTDCEAPTEQDLVALSEEFSLPLAALQSCMNPEALPKYETWAETTLIIFRIYDPTSDVADGSIQELSTKLVILIQDDRILTIHRHKVSFLPVANQTGVHAYFTRKEFLRLLTSQAILSYDQQINELENKATEIEERVYALQRTRILRSGYLLKRRANAFKKIFRFTMEALTRLSARPELTWEDFQDIRDMLNRLSFYTDEVAENLSGLLNLHISLLSQKTNEASFKTNEVMRVLTVFSIFFLPLNFIAGIYGMNFAFMPELSLHNGYFITLSVMFLIATVIFIWVYRKGWLAKPENHFHDEMEKE